MLIQEPVQAAIWQCLNHYDFSDAIFLAERLHAEVASEDSLFLLATCYYRAGKQRQVYTLLRNKDCQSPQCRYLLAKCCVEINKLTEAEAALCGNILQKCKSHEDTINQFGEAASFALTLLAKIYSKTERKQEATESYKHSLRLNPCLWSSFEALSNQGEKPDPQKTFQTSSGQKLVSMCQSSSPAVHVEPPPPHKPESNPFTVSQVTSNTNIYETPENVDIGTPDLLMPPSAPITKRRSTQRNMFGGAVSPSPLRRSFGILPLEDTPSPGHKMPFITPSPIAPLSEVGVQDPKAPSKKTMMTRRQQQLHNKPPVFSLSGNVNSIRDSQPPSSQPSIQNSIGPALRRSTRLFSNASSSVKENNKNQSPKKIASPRAPIKKSKARTGKSQPDLNEINKEEMNMFDNSSGTNASTQAALMCMQKQSAEGLMNLLQELGKGYAALAQYDCCRAIQLFSSLPPHHLQTGWVLCQVGRAYFELCQYQKAEKIFAEVRQLEPYHLQGMEFYSTTLWHLEREFQLSTLAQELTDLDQNAAETWCATGNCFSLQKEHDVAIKFFQRAVQVDPGFAYAYTLLGHEYVLTEELDKALACYRNAVRVDRRHYNAWYGLGMIYYKQENFTFAEFHYRRALAINPHSSVLLCHLAVVQHALKKSEAALQTLNKAIAEDAKNPLCKFHKASILFASDKHEEALRELEDLKRIVPRESLVYFLMGKVHKKLGNTDLALMNFSWAMDLDPKGANNQIKEAIDKRYVTDEDELVAGLGDVLEDPVEGSSNDSSLTEFDGMQLQAAESDESL